MDYQYRGGQDFAANTQIINDLYFKQIYASGMIIARIQIGWKRELIIIFCSAIASSIDSEAVEPKSLENCMKKGVRINRNKVERGNIGSSKGIVVS